MSFGRLPRVSTFFDIVIVARFCRIDPEHPDNKDIYLDFEGNPYVHSLPPVYSLDLVLQSENQAYPMNYSVTVGIAGDTLKIVVPYPE